MPLDALTPEERKALLMSIGTHRGTRSLSPVEVARLLRKVIDAGASLASCATAVHLEGTSQVSRFLSLLRLPEDVQHVVDWGHSGATLAFTAAFELSRLETPEDQRSGVEAVLRHDLTTAEVRQLVQARKRSGKPMDDCVEAILRMRPRVELRHVFVGAVLEEDLRRRLAGLSQQQRDEILANALTSSFSELKTVGRLGSERFTIVGGAELGAALKADKDNLEALLNKALRREVAG